MLIYYLLSGICLFSLIDCIANRKVKHINYWSDRSRCDVCTHPLAFYDLIPIVSYVLLKGKCRYCGKAIPKEILYMEILGGAAGVIAYCKGNFLILLLIGNLVLISLIDQKSMDVYLDTILSLVIIVFLLTFQDPDLIHRISGMFLIPGLMGMFNLIHKDSFGMGDLEVSMIMGWFFGFPKIIIVTWIGTLCGCFFFIVQNKRNCIRINQHFPLIPFLFIGYLTGIVSI